MEDGDAQKILDLYIHDYLVRKNMYSVAETFAKEADFCPKNVSLNPPDGFLTEWWSIFWDMYTSTMAKNSEQGEMLASKMFGSMGRNVHPNVPTPTPTPMLMTMSSPMPDMSSIIHNINPDAVRIPRLPNILQSINPPLMSRPNIGSLIQNPSTSTVPRPEKNPNRFGPSYILDSSARHGQGITNYLEEITREQELHRIQAARGFNFNSQLLNVDLLASMMPSSSTPRRVHKTLSINNQPPVNRSYNFGSILKRPAPLRVEPKPSQTRGLQIKTEHVDAECTGHEWDEYLLEEGVKSLFVNEVPANLSPSTQTQLPLDNLNCQGFNLRKLQVSTQMTANSCVVISQLHEIS